MQTIVKYIGKTVKIGLIVSIGVFVFMVSLELLYVRKLVLDKAFFEEIFQYVVFGVVLTIINNTYFDYLNNKVIWGAWEKYRLMIGVVGSIMDIVRVQSKSCMKN